MECEICCEKYTNTKRKEVVCPYCAYTACLSCYKSFILMSDTAKCMSCDKELTRYFLSRTFPVSFMSNEYKKHQEDILLEQEKALMPDTQIYAIRHKRKVKFMEEIKKLKEENRKLQNKIYKNTTQIEVLNRRIHKMNLNRVNKNETKSDENEQLFTQPCRNNDCRGYLDSKWVCRLCSKKTCRHCFELKEEDEEKEHKCDESNIETAKLIKKDTKPCPNCHSLIYKISGCDQMWCTVCHIAFSWKTGKQENRIHNPHYFAWIRENGVQDEQRLRNHDCGVLTQNHAEIILHQHNELTRSEKNILCVYIQSMIHNTLNYRIDNLENQFQMNRELRVKYLVNEISENQLKISIQRNNKKKLKINEITQVNNLMNTVFLDIINRFIDTNHVTVFQELEEIRLYCNNLLTDISKTYNCVEYKYNDNFLLR